MKSLHEKTRKLSEQTEEVARKLESDLRQEFLAYIRNIRKANSISNTKEQLGREIVATAESIISSLLSEQSENKQKAD